MDARNCQTSTVAPAEPGVFPFVIKSALDSFARCLDRLSTPDMPQDIFDEMVDELKKRRNIKSGFVTNARKPVMRSDFAKVTQMAKIR